MDTISPPTLNHPSHLPDMIPLYPSPLTPLTHLPVLPRYEDMKGDEAGTVQKISNFLGHPVSPEESIRIAELTTFNKMQKDPTANFQWNDWSANEGFRFIRKGIVGDYKNYFTKDQFERVKEKLDKSGIKCYSASEFSLE